MIMYFTHDHQPLELMGKDGLDLSEGGITVMDCSSRHVTSSLDRTVDVGKMSSIRSSMKLVVTPMDFLWRYPMAKQWPSMTTNVLIQKNMQLLNYQKPCLCHPNCNLFAWHATQFMTKVQWKLTKSFMSTISRIWRCFLYLTNWEWIQTVSMARRIWTHFPKYFLFQRLNFNQKNNGLNLHTVRPLILQELLSPWALLVNGLW